MATTALDTLLGRLTAVRQTAAGRYLARCPAHEDQQPSLGISLGDDGRVLLLCRAGCPTQAVLDALELTLRDLFPAPASSGRDAGRIAATYDYCGTDGTLRYQVVRFEPKDFRVRRPDGSGGWIWNLGQNQPVAYRLAELAALPSRSLVVVVEGEQDAERLWALGIAATTNHGGAGKWRRAHSEALRGHDVVVLPDNDEPGRRHAQAVVDDLAGIAISVHSVELSGLPPKGDVTDWLDAGGTFERLRELLIEGPVGRSGLPDEGRARPPLRVLPRPADAEPAFATLAETLDALVAHLLRYIHFAKPEYAHAIALWAAHSHTDLELLEQSPILALTSAVKQSGKTKLLDILEPIVHQPWRITRPSEAVLFRKIDRDHPTILLDEIDAIFHDRASATEGIRSLFNSGNRRGTKVPRVVAKGKSFELVEFDVFCPKVTAGIGGLPDTVLDRAIVIPMERRAKGERVERLRDRQARALGRPIHDALAANIGRIGEFTVDDALLPPQLDERAQDGWESLLAIASAAGGEWPARARRAAVAIFGQRRSDGDNHELRLLTDCRTVFAGMAVDFLPTTEFRQGLLDIEDSPWNDIRGKPISAHYIGRLLGRFEIESCRQRPDGTGNPVRGYLRSDFQSAWSRYLSQESGTSDASGTAPGSSAPTRTVAVPDVPLVPDARLTDERPVDMTAEALRIFADDVLRLPYLA